MTNDQTCKTHCHCLPALISGVIFSAAAVLHFIRILMGWSLVINNYNIPAFISILIVILAGSMAVWNFCRCSCCHKCRGDKAKCCKPAAKL